MDKEAIKKIINEKFNNIVTKKLFLQQLDNYFQYNEKNVKKYQVGDEVFLTRDSLIHGSRIEPEKISLIKENGLIASEFYSQEKIIKKKPYVVEFWNIEKEMSL